MTRSSRRRLTSGTIALGLAGVLYYFGNLSGVASLILGLAFVEVRLWLSTLTEAASFRPYRLIVAFHYEAIRTDFGLAETAEPRFEQVTFHALRAGLYTRSDELAYSSLPNLWREIPCSSDTWGLKIGIGHRNPVVFLRVHKDGLQIGLQVDEDWWQSHRAQLSPDFSTRGLSNRSELILALLPHGYIPEHVRTWNEPASRWSPSDPEERKWRNLLAQQGWTCKEHDPGWVTHRYATLRYSEI